MGEMEEFPVGDKRYRHTRLWDALVTDLTGRIQAGTLSVKIAKKLVRLFNEVARETFADLEKREAEMAEREAKRRKKFGKPALLSAPKLVASCQMYNSVNGNWKIEATDAVLTLRDRSTLNPGRITIYVGSGEEDGPRGSQRRVDGVSHRGA